MSSPDRIRFDPVDADSLRISRSEIFGNYIPLVERIPFARKIIRGFWHLLGKEYFLYNLSLGWSNRLNVEKLMGVNSLDAYNIKLVWGMSAGLLDGGNSALKIARYYDVPWVLELHDPPIGADIHCEYPSIKETFSSLLEECSLIIPNTNTYKKLLIKKTLQIDKNKRPIE